MWVQMHGYFNAHFTKKPKLMEGKGLALDLGVRTQKVSSDYSSSQRLLKELLLRHVECILHRCNIIRGDEFSRQAL